MKVYRLLITVLAGWLISGCASILPTTKTFSSNAWTSFDDIDKQYKRVILGITTINDLKEMGFDPYTASNVKIDSYLDVRQRFDPLGTGLSIPKEVKKCLNNYDLCKAYVANISYTENDRDGNAFLDLTGFVRQVTNSGWNFQAVFIINNDIVVYKLWSGDPNIKKVVIDKQPLGPLQNIDDILTGFARVLY